jgi:hypothetical protein
MRSIHNHPNPLLNKLTQYGAIVLLVVMLTGAVALVVLGITDPRLLLLAPAGLIVLALAPAVLMVTTISPPLTVSPDGLTVRPTIWRSVDVPWSAVREFSEYPLLPPSDSEIGRKMISGRKKYRPAEGKLLVIPSLPAIYKINGLFCGRGLTPVIGFTNRSHADYDKLLKKVTVYLEEAGNLSTGTSETL